MRPVFALFVVTATLLSACLKPELPQEKDTGGSDGQTTSAYVGEWDYTSIVLTNGTLSAQGQNLGTFDGDGVDIVGKVVITQDPNIYTTTLEFTADIEATVFGQTFPQQIPVEQRTSSGTWSEVNGNIKLVDDNGNDVEVISSSSSSIQFRGNFTESVTVGGQFSMDANSDVIFTIQK